MTVRFFARTRLSLGLCCIAAALSGCVNVRYDDEHADRNTRMYLVAQRFNQAMKTGGMFGVTADIESCYRETTTPVVRRFALQDCLSYDYAAFTFDKVVGQRWFQGARVLYFENNVASPRILKYGKLDGFGDPSELQTFVMTNKDMIIRDLQRIQGSVFAAPTNARPRLMHGGGSL